jgi:uncharacterized protein (TIGR03790 family)
MRGGKFDTIMKHWNSKAFGITVLCGLALAIAGATQTTQAGPPVESGSTVAVVYNTGVPESKDVAFHYAGRRHVPANQVLGLDLPTSEMMTRADYNTKLALPLARWAQTNHLMTFAPGYGPGDPPTLKWRVQDSRIRYVVLCYGVPVKIAHDPGVVEPEAAQMPEGARRNGGAVDSELALLPQGFARVLTGPAVNPFYCATNPAAMNPVNGVLMVTRLDGPSAAVARALVDKAMEAETNGLWGRGYFDARGLTNGPFYRGDEWICSAAEYTRRFGYPVVLDTNEGTFPASFPMSHIAFYAGWYCGVVNGPFTRPAVEFMPGAFAYHLHSFSALSIRTNNVGWVGPLLAAGATATMGCVDEPFLDGTPNLAIFFNRWLAPGFSFGEAAYASSETLSWQLTVVGDPLYRPFSQAPAALHQDLVRRHSPLVAWSHARVIGLNFYRGTSIAEMIQYLQGQPETQQSAVLQELLGDLFAKANNGTNALAAWQQALRCSPSPQQRVRLVFEVSQRLQAAGREAEAFALLEGFYKETPDYPDASHLCQTLETMAGRLKNTSDAKRYHKEVQRLEKKTRAGDKK